MKWFIKSRNNILGIVMSSIVFITGCHGIAPVSVRHIPSESNQNIFIGAPQVKLQVKDAREQKVFFRTVLGDNDDEGKNGILRLITPPEKAFEEGFTQALQSSGYSLREDAELVYEVRIKRFLANDPQKSPHFLDSDIILEILIKRSGAIIARKTISERDTEKMTFGQVWQNVVPTLLSRSLSNAIEKAIQDKDLNAALGTKITIVARTPELNNTLPGKQYSLPQKPPKDFLKRDEFSETKKHDNVKTAPIANESRSHGYADETNFVIKVIKGFPHRFPQGNVKGLWLSSVPLNLDVFAFPKGYRGKFKVFEDWVSNRTNTPYYLGKTPLLAKMKKGMYEVLFVHPPIEDKNYKPKYRTRRVGTLGITGQYQICPFIAQKCSVLYAVGGVQYWAEERKIEVRSQDNFETAIVLFQREDQTFDDILKNAPVEENFTFSSVDLLREPNGLTLKLEETFADYDTELSSREVGEKPSFYLSQEEVNQAEKMLKRTGVWAKKFSDVQTLAIEVKPNKTDWFTLRYPLTMKGVQGMILHEFTNRMEPDQLQSRIPKSVITDVPPTPQPSIKQKKIASLSLPADGVYSKDIGRGGSYKDSIHGFFEVEPPKDFKIVEQWDRTTTRLDNGTVIPCSRIRFQSDKARIAVVTRKTFRGTIEEDSKIAVNNLRSAGAKIATERFITIDGSKGIEVVAIAAGYRLLLVKYKNHGLDHAITMTCSPADFSKFKKEFIVFLCSYRSLKPD